jgi:hypothetical protein
MGWRQAQGQGSGIEGVAGHAQPPYDGLKNIDLSQCTFPDFQLLFTTIDDIRLLESTDAPRFTQSSQWVLPLKAEPGAGRPHPGRARVGQPGPELGGGFRGDRQLGCQKPGDTPNLRPRRLTITSNGEPLEEVDFSDLGLAEPVLLFDAATGCKKELGGNLDPNCDYALLCDTDMMVPDVPAWRTKNRYAFFLSRPLTVDTRLLCDGTLCWQPQLIDRKPRRVISVSIESLSGKSIELGSEAQLVIKDASEDAEEVTSSSRLARVPFPLK